MMDLIKAILPAAGGMDGLLSQLSAFMPAFEGQIIEGLNGAAAEKELEEGQALVFSAQVVPIQSGDQRQDRLILYLAIQTTTEVDGKKQVSLGPPVKKWTLASFAQHLINSQTPKNEP